MVVLKELLEGSDANLLVHENRDPITNREEGVEVVGHHEHGQAEASL